MAFCAYCGKQVPDGQLCDCAESRAAQGAGGWQPQQGMPMGNINQQPQMNPGMDYQAQRNQQVMYQEQARQAAAQATQSASQAASQAGNILNETFGHFLLILKAPSTAGSNFVAAASMKASCAMVLIQAIVAGLFSLIIANKINGLAGSAMGWLGGMSKNTKVDLLSPAKAFFITMLMSIIFALLFALLSWGVAGLSKAKTNFNQMFAVSGVRAAFLIPVAIISIVVFLINPVMGIGAFFIGGMFFSMASQMESMHGVMGMDHNTKTYLVVIMMIIFCGIVCALTVKVMPQTISSFYLKTVGDAMEEISDFDFKDLLDILDYFG